MSRITVGLALALAACSPAPSAVVARPEAATAGPAYLPSASSKAVVDISTNAYGAFAAAPSAPGLGDIAPDFALPTATGGTFSLSDAVESGEVAIVFFRGFW